MSTCARPYRRTDGEPRQTHHRIASTAEDPRVTLELSGGITRPPFTSANNGDLQRLAISVAKELGVTVFEVEPTGGGSDGNFAAALGVLTLDALGPVSTDVCSRRETISIASLVERAALFAGIVQNLPSLDYARCSASRPQKEACARLRTEPYLAEPRST